MLIIPQVKSLENGEAGGSSKELEYFQGGKVTKENMTEFMKEIKKAGNLTDEEAAQIAALPPDLGPGRGLVCLHPVPIW